MTRIESEKVRLLLEEGKTFPCSCCDEGITDFSMEGGKVDWTLSPEGRWVMDVDWDSYPIFKFTCQNSEDCDVDTSELPSLFFRLLGYGREGDAVYDLPPPGG